VRLGGAEPKLEVGGVPRVDLLPPEVHARRQDARLNRVLLIALVVVVALAGVAVLGAKVVADGSAGRLAAAQARTGRLLAEQRRFAAVSGAQSRLAATRAARTTVAGQVIDWRGYLKAVSATLPSGAHVTAATVETATATTATGTAPTATAPPGTVATLTLQVGTAHWTDVQAWLTALPRLRGFLDASPSTVSSDPQNGVLATVVVHVGAGAYGSVAPDSSSAAAVPAVSGAGSTATPSPLPTATATATATSGPAGTPAPPPSTPAPARTSPKPVPAASSPAPLAAGTTGGNG
jgi:hypothetical protein